MTECFPRDTLLATQKAFAERVGTIETADDLSAFIKDVDVWLHSPGVSNSVAPNALDAQWRTKLKGAPFHVTDDEKNALANGIRAFTFHS
jgi:hypothetical protein